MIVGCGNWRKIPLSRFGMGVLAFLVVGVWISGAQIPAPDDAPKPKSPEESAAAFQLPEGFRMEVVASEPLVQSPSGVCWDERGRLFVTELHGYNLEGELDIRDLNRSGKLDTEVRRVQAAEVFKKAAQPGTYGVVKQLRDMDGDGRMDRADIWSTNLPPAYGLVPARGGVIVACAPEIIYLADRDGDGVAEVREVLFTGFRTGPLERGINAPQWGTDGWIYFGRGVAGGKVSGPHLAQPVSLQGVDFRIRADGTAIEPVTGATGTFGFALSEDGERFTMGTTTPGRHVAPLPWRSLIRNPNVRTPPLETSTGDPRVYPLAPAHPWRTKRAADAAYFKFYRDRYGASDSDAGGWFTSACGAMIYEDDVLPGLRGHYFVCEPSGNILHRSVVVRDGVSLTLRRFPGEERSEFGASRDSWSHPISLSHGPDGSIWITDYYREIIEDYSAIPRHLQQQYGVYAGHDRGRIYRLTHRDAGRGRSPDFSGLDVKALALELQSGLLWRRQTAQRLLLERGDPSAVPVVAAAITDSASGSGVVIRALYTLDAWNELRPDLLIEGLRHASDAVRVHALRLSERWLNRDEGRGLLSAILKVAEEENRPRVRLQLALTLGESPSAEAFQELARMALSMTNQDAFETAILSSLNGRELDMLRVLSLAPGNVRPLIMPLAQAIAARRDTASLEVALSIATRAVPMVQMPILLGLSAGRKHVPRAPLGDSKVLETISSLKARGGGLVRGPAELLERALLEQTIEDSSESPAKTRRAESGVTEALYGSFLKALSGARDVERGQAVFREACSTCHRVGGVGFEVGPDLMGQVGLGEEGLLKEILMPSERIRPGYEATLVQVAGGAAVTGIVKDDGATSLNLALPNGVLHSVLRKDIEGIRALETSLMPSFAETLSPADAAHLIAWLVRQYAGDFMKREGRSAKPTGERRLEAGVEPFLGEPRFELQTLFRTNRFPNVVVAMDGSVLTFWNGIKVRRSEDGGATWGEEIRVGAGFMGGGVTVDEATGRILAFVEAAHPPSALTVYASEDHGKTWRPFPVVVRPDRNGRLPSMHMNEHGITLRRGRLAGRLIRPTRYYAGANERGKWPEHFTNAIFSDDGGKTWQTSDPFPAFGTGEATVAELTDGTLYYNSRRHWAPPGEDPRRRWIASSDDGGQTWKDLWMCRALPDGDQDRDYGLMGGLARLPVEGRDVLIFSNIDSPSGRHHGQVWLSADGGKTWPIRRSVFDGSFAYSSIDAGRPGTASEGWIYVFFEGGPVGGGTLARLNLTWLLQGERTGDGSIAPWLAESEAR